MLLWLLECLYRPLIWLYWDVSRTWLKFTCGKFNWLDMCIRSYNSQCMSGQNQARKSKELSVDICNQTMSNINLGNDRKPFIKHWMFLGKFWSIIIKWKKFGTSKTLPGLADQPNSVLDGKDQGGEQEPNDLANRASEIPCRDGRTCQSNHLRHTPSIRFFFVFLVEWLYRIHSWIKCIW